MKKTQALLVYSNTGPLDSLKQALQALAVETNRVETCRQARSVLRQAAKPPDVVFTDAALPDGTWREVLAIAEGGPAHPKIVVVSRTEDPWFYLNAMEQGAFDFMIPPFAAVDVDHVVRCAARASAARAASA